MRWWQKLFGGQSGKSAAAPEPAEPTEQAVLVYLRLSDDQIGTDAERFQIHQLSLALQQTVSEQQVGEFDGEEFDDGRCTLYLYGPDADALFAAIEPLLRTSPLARGGKAIKCYAPIPGRDADEVEIEL